MDFRIDLETFRGPLDLLLYLVRKHEVEIVDIPIATITDQYLQYLAVLKQLDVNTVGDFLEMASTLVEIKSRLVLPRAGEEEEIVEDPRQDLVKRLLEYKELKDAASILEERGRTWQERFARRANDSPDRGRDLADEPIQELELWDLVSAFGRIMRDYHVAVPSNIVYDDTPIHVYMSRIHDRLRGGNGRLAFGDLFEAGMHKSALIGMFLAVLELVRHHGVRAEQQQLHGEIWLSPGEGPPESVDPAKVDNYAPPAAQA